MGCWGEYKRGAGILLLTLVVVGTFSTPCSAQTYFAVEAGISQPVDQISKSTAIKTDAEFKVGPAFASALGKRFNREHGPDLRIEAELSFRHNKADTFNVATVAQPLHTNGTRAFTGAINGFIDFDTSARLTPFIGAGLGVVRADQHFAYSSNLLQGHSTSLAWQLLGGVSLPLGTRSSLYIKGRYVSAPSLRFARTTVAGVNRLGSEYDGFIASVGIQTFFGPVREKAVHGGDVLASPWYFSAQLGGAFIENQRSEGSGQLVETTFAPGAFAALAIGRSVPLGRWQLRPELEFSSRQNDTKNLAFAGFDLTNISGNGAYDFVLMGNVLLDTPSFGPLRLYAGAGAGIVHSAVYARYGSIFIDGSDETFGWQGRGGLSFKVDPRMEYFVEGRYVYAKAPTFVRITPFGRADLRSQYRALSFGAGFRYIFGKK